LPINRTSRHQASKISGLDMLIPEIPTTASWEVVARSVFWSREVELPVWREMCLQGHPSYLPDSVGRMSTKNFIRFFGREIFVKFWPTLRDSASLINLRNKGVPRLDIAWSVLATGTINMPPEASLAKFPGRSREVYDAVVHHQGASIYEIAVESGIPYRRVHSHVGAMEARGIMRSHVDLSGPRRKRRLYTFK
jgi:hypothetical protein